MKKKFSECFVNPEILKRDLSSIYISSFFATQLRELFTEKERYNYIALKAGNIKVTLACSGSDNVTCLTVLSTATIEPERNQVSVFQRKGVLDNFKASYFLGFDLITRQDSFTDMTARDQSVIEIHPAASNIEYGTVYNSDEVLIERELHTCAIARHDFDKSRLLKERLGEIDAAAIVAKDMVYRYLAAKSDPELAKKGFISGGASAARRNNPGDVSWVNANGYSFEEDDKTITDMLDLKDKPSLNMKSPQREDKKYNQQIAILPSQKDSYNFTEITRHNQEDEDNDCDLFFQDDQISQKDNKAGRKIEEEMNRFEANRGIFKRVKGIEGNEDEEIWTVMTNPKINKFNILNMMAPKDHKT